MSPTPSGPPSRSSGYPLLLLIACGILFFWRLGGPGLFDADEPAYAEAAREMLRSGDWVTPRLNGEPRFDKPILFYWLLAVSYRIFGVTEFAARFWPATFGLLLVLSVYGFGRRVMGEAAGRVAGLALATSLGTVVLARAAVTDMLLTTLLTWGVGCFFESLFAPPSRRDRWLWAGYAFLALALLSKGPLALVLPTLTLVPFVLVRGDGWRGLGRLRPLAGAALVLLLAGPWYGAVLWRHGWGFIDAFVLKHHIGRYTGVISGHPGPLYYYVPVALIGFFPWSAFLPRPVWQAVRLVAGRAKGWDRREALIVLSAIWFAAVLAFFSGAGTKLPSYLYPAFPAMALLVGSSERRTVAGERVRRDGWEAASEWLLGILGGILAAGMLALPAAVARAKAAFGPRLADLPVPSWEVWVLAACLGVGVVLALWLRRRGRGTPALGTLGGMMMAVVVVVVWRFVPPVYAALQAPLRAMAERSRHDLGGGERLILYGLNAPSVTFYADRSVVKVGAGQQDRLRALLAAPRRSYLIAPASLGEPLVRTGDVFPLIIRGGYGLYSSRPLASHQPGSRQPSAEAR